MQGIKWVKILLYVIFFGALTACSEDEKVPTIKPPGHYSKSVAINQIIKLKMAAVGAGAATLAVYEHGTLVFTQAYGHQDANKTQPMQANALMRTASNVKPITAAALNSLARSGVLQLSDHAFCTGNNAPCWLSGFMYWSSQTGHFNLSIFKVDWRHATVSAM